MPDDSPVPRTLRHGLRVAALDLKAQRARGHVAPTVWAGTPGARTDEATLVGFDTAVLPARTTLDRGDRVEIALALAHLVRPSVAAPMFWMTRSGAPELCDPDLAWLSATRAACEILGLEHAFAVVTREGWRHEPTGVMHRWKRLRT